MSCLHFVGTVSNRLEPTTREVVDESCANDYNDYEIDYFNFCPKCGDKLTVKSRNEP